MNDYSISTDTSLFDVNKIHSLLKDCYWSKNIPIEYVRRFIKYSLCFGIYQNKSGELVGFGRVISDYTTYAYVCDLIIDVNHRNKGLANQLMNVMMSHPDLQGLKVWSLRTTEEARGIYLKYGFSVAGHPDTHMEIENLNIYSEENFVNLHKESLSIKASSKL